METQSGKEHCPLCRGKEIDFYHDDRTRMYLCCRHCSLIFVPDSYWLSRQEEKALYDLHENNSEDQGYRSFLSRLCTPLQARLQPNKKGLDFGCGPGPTLSVMLEENSLCSVALYDPFYYNDPSLLEREYDFICATEVIEHLRDPDKEFRRLFDMLGPGGTLAIMTKLATGRQAFSNWHYIRDPSHICFYSQATFAYLARRFTAGLEIIGSDVIMLLKKE